MALSQLTKVQQDLMSEEGATIQRAGSAAMIDTPIIEYKNKITRDTTISSDAPTAVMYIDRSMTIDIEPGVTVTVDSDCAFCVVDL